MSRSRAPVKPPDPRALAFQACRRRVAEGCGGHHALAPSLTDLPLSRWHVCGDTCPIRREVASWLLRNYPAI